MSARRAAVSRKLRELLRLKVRFALTSAVATAVDYGLYLVLVYTWLDPVLSHAVSYSVAVLLNFALQKRFIFSLERRLSRAFAGAMAVSAGGLALGALLIWWLTRFPFFDHHQYVTKLCVTAILFFYNFYMKRYAFEGRFF